MSKYFKSVLFFWLLMQSLGFSQEAKIVTRTSKLMGSRFEITLVTLQEENQHTVRYSPKGDRENRKTYLFMGSQL
jgi:hypothetical protein